jgi:hypothetical protein
MRIMTKLAAAAALSAAVLATASPSLAQRGEDGMSAPRAKALRECNAEAGKMTQSTSASIQLDMYRACMMQHGEQQE